MNEDAAFKVTPMKMFKVTPMKILFKVIRMNMLMKKRKNRNNE
jgi:hypothetical protein